MHCRVRICLLFFFFFFLNKLVTNHCKLNTFFRDRHVKDSAKLLALKDSSGYTCLHYSVLPTEMVSLCGENSFFGIEKLFFYSFSYYKRFLPTFSLDNSL